MCRRESIMYLAISWNALAKSASAGSDVAFSGAMGPMTLDGDWKYPEAFTGSSHLRCSEIGRSLPLREKAFRKAGDKR